MGKSNVPLLTVTTLATQSERVGLKLMGGASTFGLLGWEVSVRDFSVLVIGVGGGNTGLCGTCLFCHRTDIGYSFDAGYRGQCADDSGVGGE